MAKLILPYRRINQDNRRSEINPSAMAKFPDNLPSAIFSTRRMNLHDHRCVGREILLASLIPVASTDWKNTLSSPLKATTDHRIIVLCLLYLGNESTNNHHMISDILLSRDYCDLGN